MSAYKALMAKQIAEEISIIQDPEILSIYLRAIQFQRCKIGGAKPNTCKGCMYQSYYCRQLNEMYELESKMFNDNDNKEKTNEALD